MKVCEQVLLYAQNELTADEKTAFEAHLDGCKACQDELKFLAKLDEGLAPKSAPQHVIDSLFAKTTRRKSVFAKFKLAWTACGALAVAMGVFLVSVSSPRPFDAHDLVAYMNASSDDEYSSFAQELRDLQEEINELEMYL